MRAAQKRFVAYIAIVFLAATAALVWQHRAAAGSRDLQDIIQTIDRVPLVISTPGKYQFATDLTCDQPGAAIEIACDNVSIDFAGHELRSTLAKPETSETKGVAAHNRKKIRIHSGRITGFTWGVALDGDAFDRSAALSHGWHIVRGMTINDCSFRGVRTSGINCLIVENQIARTGGCTLWPNAFAFGIEAVGPEARVLDNEVIDTAASGSGEAVAISVDSVDGRSLVFRNTVCNRINQPNRDIGIWAGTNVAATISANRIEGFTWGVAASSTTVTQLLDNTFSACDIAEFTAKIATEVPGRVITAGRVTSWPDADAP
ncbi:MAG: hypothetical protein SFY96_11625 [Planctomycetota bacterium]|nr:hypothetical protein [Planctomycetota bacterium]